MVSILPIRNRVIVFLIVVFNSKCVVFRAREKLKHTQGPPCQKIDFNNALAVLNIELSNNIINDDDVLKEFAYK